MRTVFAYGGEVVPGSLGDWIASAAKDAGASTVIAARSPQPGLASTGAATLIETGDPGSWPASADQARDALASAAAVVAVGLGGGALFSSVTFRGADGPSTAFGLGLIPLSLCLDHDDAEVAQAYYGWTWKRDVPAGIALDAGACARLEDGAVTAVAALTRGAHCYEVQHVAGEVICRGRWADLLART